MIRISTTAGPASVEHLLNNSDPNQVDKDVLTSGAWQMVQSSSSSKKRDQVNKTTFAHWNTQS